jgi:phosphatidylserine/phosphatidylglycerophosphate/cardiolipin synthase-like enzyme
LSKNAIEIKIATGYFFISGFNLVQEELEKLRKPILQREGIDSPFKIIMGNQTDLLTRDQIILGYRKELDKITNPDHISNISSLYTFIRNEKVDIRVYTKKLFHPKLYLFKNKTDGSLTGNRFIIGSSNFSYSGGTNNLELNLFKINDPCFSYLEKWFDTLWFESEEFKSDLIKLIEDSDLYKNNPKLFDKSKKYIYLPPLLFFSNIIKALKKSYLLEIDNILLPFQEIDYKVSKDIIQKYGGVIIANSVGLGKSYIASKILSDYYKQNKKILLIIPPNLREQWVGYLRLLS